MESKHGSNGEWLEHRTLQWQLGEWTWSPSYTLLSEESVHPGAGGLPGQNTVTVSKNKQHPLPQRKPKSYVMAIRPKEWEESVKDKQHRKTLEGCAALTTAGRILRKPPNEHPRVML